MNRDALGGLVLVLLAGCYHVATGSIADSTLEDEVGASGLPRVLAVALAVIGAILLVRGLLAARSAAAARSAVAADRAAPGGADAEPDEPAPGDAPLPRAVGFLAFGAAYLVALPYLGYPVGVALLIAGVALFEGARRPALVAAVAAGGALLYWAIFVKLLGVHQPVGTLWQGFLS